MRTVLAALVLATLVIVGASDIATAQSRTTLGVGSGAVAGALVGGPIGAVAGAVVGGFVGNSSERGHRRIRPGRRYSQSTVRRAYPRRAEAELPRPAPVAARATPAPATTGWKDPR